MPTDKENKIPVYINVAGKYYLQKSISDKVLECMEELFHRIIKTSQTPTTILKRLALLKEQPKARQMVWTEAFKRVMKNEKAISLEEIKEKHGQEFHVLDLEEMK